MEYRYRVWNSITDCPIIYIPVATPLTGAQIISAMCHEQAGRDDIEYNVFGLEEWDGSEWVEWYDVGGEDIDWLIDQIEEACPTRIAGY